ncbi:MAG TPA: PAS domain S-box protein [Pyrinomonadaceae bacterium]|nr:PAS domain S-box protein [Pyrinomonadaceae bacterium]
MDKDPAQSQLFLRQLLDASFEGILAFDRDCRYTAWNQAMERISGLRRQDVLGKSAFVLFPFLKETGENKCLLAALAGESSISENTPYTIPETGRHGFFKGYYSSLRNEQNEITGGIAVIHDITERKRAEEEAHEIHQRLTFHVENSPLAVIEWDSEARVSRWSESAERLFGWKAEEVLGKHVGEWHFVFDEDVDAVAQVTHRQRAGAELLGVQRNRNYTRDGSILYCEWYNSVLHDDAGKMVSVLSLVLDVSARKLAEEERTALLSRERDLRQQAEEADRLKDEFLATLSHELRTPLTSILGWATLIRTGDIDESNVPNAIQIIERNARSQARLIDDLLDVSRIITGKLQLDVHPIDMAPLVESANEALRPAAAAKGMRVETELNVGSCLVSGDANRLGQVIWNLIMNAIKFTPRGGKINVRLECLPGQGEEGKRGMGEGEDPMDSGAPLSPFPSSPVPPSSPIPPSPVVRLTVTDTGEGIKPDFLPYVFHRFRQEESSISRKAGGLGLGLAVVRHLVELHGGNVSADSAGPGQGSTFVVELPLAQVTRQATPPKDAALEGAPSDAGGASDSPGDGKLDGIRVLLVEDDDDSRILLTVLLERRGAEVIAASSSAEALNWFTQQLSPPASSAGSTPPARQTDLSEPPALAGGPANALSQPPALTSGPHVIISDLGLPDEDGYEFMRKIRLLFPTSGPLLPAIALTGYATVKDREQAFSVGYQLHLAKPVEPEDLAAAILSLLSSPSESEDPRKDTKATEPRTF